MKDLVYHASKVEVIYKEAKALEKLSYSSIVQLYHAFIWEKNVVLIMEYIPGGELYQYVKAKNGINELEARKIFKQLAYTVEYCHNKYIIHRDLKPSNILIYNQDTLDIKLIDFGISGSNYGKDKSTAGSLAYMPPEVLANDNTAADPAIDVWALGVILYFMVYGYLPFHGSSEKELGKAILAGKVIFFEEKKKITEGCKKLIKSLLTKDPKKRIKIVEALQSEWFELPDAKLEETVKTSEKEKLAEENKATLRKTLPITHVKSHFSEFHRKSGGDNLVVPNSSKSFGTPNRIGKKSPLPSKTLINKATTKSKEKK